MINHPNAAMGAAATRGSELLADAERLARAESAFRQAIGDPGGFPFGARSVRRAVRMPLVLKRNPLGTISPDSGAVRSPRPRLSASRLLARVAARGLAATSQSQLAVETPHAGSLSETKRVPGLVTVAGPAEAGTAA